MELSANTARGRRSLRDDLGEVRAQLGLTVLRC